MVSTWLHTSVPEKLYKCIYILPSLSYSNLNPWRFLKAANEHEEDTGNIKEARLNPKITQRIKLFLKDCF